MVNALITVSTSDGRVREALELQVCEFLEYVKREARARIRHPDDIKLQLQALATDAANRTHIRWRMLDFLAFESSDSIDVYEARNLLESFIILIESAVRGNVEKHKPRLTGVVKKLYDGKFPSWSPLDLFRCDASPTAPSATDYSGYEEALSKGICLAVRVNSRQIFTDFGLIHEPQKSQESTFMIRLTEAQRQAYESLEHFLDLRRNPRIAGGIQPRPHALLIGPSGVGKSGLVRAFAEDLLAR